MSVGGPEAHTVPGIIAVGASANGPLVAPVQVGVDPRIAAATALVPGGAGRRLVAKIVDGILPSILIGIASLIGSLNVKVTQVGEFAQLNLTWLLVATSIASVLSLGYFIWLWLWEAKSGKTPGNIMLGLRTTNMEGLPAGLLAIFLRHLIVGVSSIVPTIGPILVLISNTWDANGKKQGWHDKVAHTLVFNVKTGRNPLETGGIAERADFVPANVPTISQVASPMASPLASPPARPVNGAAQPGQFAPPAIQFHNQAAPSQNQPAFQNPPASAQIPPVQQANPFAPPSTPKPQIPVDQGPITSVPGAPGSARPNFASPATAQPNVAAAAVAPDEDAGETRVRPLTQNQALRLTFDDGRTEDVSGLALIGRNPAGYDGEMISRLISIQDSSRSVSKTHLHLRVSGEGLWVTDRNSTNGSGITHSAGNMDPLPGGKPALAELGSTVHFGDRYFVVGRA
ncbi:RDD family protein [Arthrobacter sp. TWP1-1]|uniref:RDD family protein n=1 Tax=Arthrobacter sp. TWP1-1 TaxID=2804568 RepID=UPI003CEF42DE